MKRTYMGIAALVLTAALAGCGAEQPVEPDEPAAPTPSETDVPETVAVDDYPGLPDTPDFDGAEEWGNEGDIVDGWIAEPKAGWVDDDETFAIVTWGSSTCVYVATDIQADGDDALSVEFTLPAHEACTADLAPLTHVFELPDSVTERPIAVTVTGVDESGWVTGGDGYPEVELTLR